MKLLEIPLERTPLSASQVSKTWPYHAACICKDNESKMKSAVMFYCRGQLFKVEEPGNVNISYIQEIIEQMREVAA